MYKWRNDKFETTPVWNTDRSTEVKDKRGRDMMNLTGSRACVDAGAIYYILKWRILFSEKTM